MRDPACFQRERLTTPGVRRWRFALSLLAVLSVACQGDPYASQFTTTKPQLESLAGRYKPDAHTHELFMRHFNIDISQSTFDLASDGSFEARRLPDCWKEMACSGKVQEISGTWTLAQHQGWWAVRLRVSRIDGIASDFGIDAMLRRDEPPYLIHFTIGDPDSGQALAFERDRSNALR